MCEVLARVGGTTRETVTVLYEYHTSMLCFQWGGPALWLLGE